MTKMLGITIQEIGIKDVAKASAFLRSQLDRSAEYGDIDTFFDKIFNNPNHIGSIAAAVEEDRIVSSATVAPKTIFIRGKRVACCEIGDTYTDPDFQKRGLFTALVNKCMEWATEHRQSFVYGTPNALSKKAYTKHLGFTTTPGIQVVYSILPLRSRIFFATRQLQPFTRVADALIGLIVNLALKPSKIIRVILGYQILNTETIPADWETFYAELLTRHDFIGDRDRQFLEWRFAHRHIDYRFVELRKAGQLFCFSVYRAFHEKGRTRIAVVDFLTIKNKKTHILFMGIELIKIALKHEADSIYMWTIAKSQLFRCTRFLGFVPRSEVPLIYKPAMGSAIPDDLKTPHFSLADSDCA